MHVRKANHEDSAVSDRKQTQLEKGTDPLRPGDKGSQDKPQGGLVMPTAADQGFVYYEE